MKSRPWSRPDAIALVRRDIWRYLTAAARVDDEVLLDASLLLQMSPAEVRTLAQLQFILSDEVRQLLGEMPRLVRRLTTTTRRETETSAERVLGPIVWSETLSARASTGLRNLYVTAPARRAFDTPENQLLRFSLSAIADFGRRTGWHRSTSEGVGREIRTRVAEATRWLATRSLVELPARPLSAETLARVRGSRRRRMYASALSTYALYQRYLKRLDRAAVRDAVEQHALVTSRDPVLLELLCAFTIVRSLQRQGWRGPSGGLVHMPLLFRGSRGQEMIEVYYQHSPRPLTRGSLYREAQRSHDFQAIGGLIPDLVLRVTRTAGRVDWILVEVKGVERAVGDSARAALQDLLAYRRAFSPTLEAQPGPYGIGIAWGEDVRPAETDEIVLCSPDTIADALALVV